MQRVVVVGASIAGVTAASSLRAAGWNGHLTVLSDEDVAPYSRVPLSKGILAGTQLPETATLVALPDDVVLRYGAAAAALHTERQVVELSDGSEIAYDGLIIATGSRARRLAAEGQSGELVVRTLADARAIAERVPGARSALVIGGGFLGMEVASTLKHHGLSVTVIDRDPPLLRLLGPWLASFIAERAVEQGIDFVLAPDGVELLGSPIRGVAYGDDRRIMVDLVVSAVGDLPNMEWLESSGLPLAGGLIVDDHCRVASRIVAAGDVTARESSPGSFRRTPHWSNAVAQGRAAALSLLDSESEPFRPDHYFWTEQFGLDVKIAGELPFEGDPAVLEGSVESGSMLLQWSSNGVPTAAVAINHRIPVVRLKALAVGELTR